MAAILVAVSGCLNDGASTTDNEDDWDSGGAQAPSSYTPPSTAPAPPADTALFGEDVGCPDLNYRAPVGIPTDLTGLLEACTNTKGELLLKNTSPLMLKVVPVGRTSMSVPTPESNDVRSAMNAELATGSSTPGVDVVIPPGGYTTAYVTQGGPAAVTIGISVFDASQSYAADVWMRYLEDRLSTPQQRLGKSVADCAKESAEMWKRSAPTGGEDLNQLLAETALGPAFQCQKLLREVSEELNEEPPKSSSLLKKEFSTLGKSVEASVWDDIIHLGQKLVQLNPR